MKRKITLIGILFILAILTAGYANAVPSCAFGGTVTDIDGNPVTGVEVRAYLQETGIPVGTSMNTISGYGFYVENASDKYLIFEVPGNFVDQGPVYCDGAGLLTPLNLTVIDNDDDGYGQGEDCDDSNSSIYPPELDCSNGMDDDCDHFIDQADHDCWDIDKDGYCLLNYEFCPTNPGKLDCNDNNANVHPDAAEACSNGIDDDCDGTVDEGCGSSGGDGGGGSTSSSGCTPVWQCTAWTTCSQAKTQTRTCTDNKNCKTTTGKPAEIQTCNYIPPTTTTTQEEEPETTSVEPEPVPTEEPPVTEEVVDNTTEGLGGITGGFLQNITGANKGIGIIILILLIGCLFYFFVLKKKRKKE